jgi:serine/threonine protein kinase
MDDEDSLTRSRARCGVVIAQNYVLDDILGLGGMGVVHAAHQRSLDRTVAVKLPRPELSDDDQVQIMFKREARASSRICHRNTVCMHDFGSHRGLPYLVMEHIAGPRLGQVLAESGSFTVAAAIDLVRQIVSALEDAHASGVVHADVKCDNVIVQTLRDGTTVPRLIDFGIARFLDEQSSPAHCERFVTGTPEYVAPEVVRGALPTPASDVYAIGIMLYELITTETPFGEGTATEIMQRKLDSDAPPVSLSWPELDVSPDLDALITRMLMRDPGSRPPDARAVARALDSITRRDLAAPAASSAPSSFSTESATARMAPAHVIRADRPSIGRRRMQVIDAIKTGSQDRIAVAYLELARSLMDERDFDAAQNELEEGVEMLMTPEGRGPVWRLLLALAALYERQGERARARVAARTARDQAARAGSTVGKERGDQLCRRLR